MIFRLPVDDKGEIYFFTTAADFLKFVDIRKIFSS
jgi:hypothetical protein